MPPEAIRRRLLQSLCAVAMGVPVARGRANPRRALRILVASPPGGLPDLIARHYAARIDAREPPVVDNRPGAGGLIAVRTLLQAGDDGATLLLGHGGLVTANAYLSERPGYDPQADLQVVHGAADTAFGLAVGGLVPGTVGDLAGLVAWARGQAAPLTAGSPGVGTLPHLLGALLAREGGFAVQHVPYLGGPPAIADLTGGRLALVVLPEGLLAPLHTAGRLRVLATSGERRSEILPAVPSFAEAGFAALVAREWFAFFAARGVAAEPLAAHAAAIRQAQGAPLAATLGEAALRMLPLAPAQLEPVITRDRRFWREAVAATGIRTP